MATETTNYNLTKPDVDDLYNVSDFNNNMDIIDTGMAQTAQQIGTVGDTLEQIAGYIGTPPNEGDTLFNHSSDETLFYSASYTIQYQYYPDEPVVIAKCPIIMRFTARHNGTIYVTLKGNAPDYSSSTVCAYDIHVGETLNAPLFSSYAIETYARYIDCIQPLFEQTAGRLDPRAHQMILPVIAGHTYIISVSTSSFTLHYLNICYDLCTREELIECDLDPYVATE